MPQRLRFSFILSLILLILSTEVSFGQTEPDTVRRKPVLPTGPPTPTTEPVRPRKQPRTIDQQPQQNSVQVQKSTEVQDEEVKEKVPLIDRLYFGGSFGLQFGTYTNISLLPIIGYKLTDKFSVGGGLVYHFRRAYGVTLQNFGGRAFTQVEMFNIGDGAIIAHGEVEYISSEYFSPFTSYLYKERTAIALPMIGLGYRQRISDKASFDLLLLYNVRKDEYANPYSNPVIRAGFNFPFRQ
ncbi:hypothetical protein ACFSKU_03950 [Pontibacter silvestris]|uniref:Outer membrane protein beta-barrel domain-containing protein n=1 Tax=Pontibacter silvestris TaxID=2305183 RepID=A0ABW4WTJ7_9BACT|nr:hypothetical protein [Pontibacter silvestris]MCC9137985.1 hypothetical protein [Pontibacter silvestris]